MFEFFHLVCDWRCNLRLSENKLYHKLALTFAIEFVSIKFVNNKSSGRD